MKPWFLDQWEATLENTSVSPWVKEALEGKEEKVELRFIAENQDHAEFLTRFPRRWDRIGPSHSLFEPVTKVWIGLPAHDQELASGLLMKWQEAMLQNYPPLFEKIGRITVIIGPDLVELSWGMNGADGGDAFLAPHLRADGKIDFLLMVNHPQPVRDRQQEIEWVEDALTHELEHVWQLLATGSTRIEPSWRSLAEKCAVYAELRDHPRNQSILDYGVDFYRRLTEGLVTPGNSRTMHHAYWAFAFVRHLEECLPDIHRTIWTFKATLKDEQIEMGPWVWLHHLLAEKGLSLLKEWDRFCRAAIWTPPHVDPVTDALKARFSRRLPSLARNLTNHHPERFEWDFWALSAHWIRVSPDPNIAWRLNWQFAPASSASALFLSELRTGDPTWKLTEKDHGDSQGTILLPAGTAIHEILFVHSSVPDMRNIYGASSYLLGSARLSLEFTK